ncbi:MAG: alpha/beta fold hydrolase, partial [Burkholderiaceae bacterium]
IGPAALPEGVRLATQCMGQVNPSTYRRALQALPSFDRQASLPNIHVPTLLIAGEHDTEAPAALMKKMAEQIAGSSYVELSGIGHLQNLEAPEEFDGAVLNFLAQARQLH